MLEHHEEKAVQMDVLEAPYLWVAQHIVENAEIEVGLERTRGSHRRLLVLA
jgi:hypothetical protein